MRRQLFAVLAIACAIAPDVHADQAEVRQVIADLARLYAPVPGATVAFTLGGEPRFVSRGAIHEIVLPDFALVVRGISLRLGDLPLVAREQNDGRIAALAQPPARATVLDPDQETLGTLELGQARFSATFDPRLFAFGAIDLAAGPLQFSAGDVVLRMASLGITHAAGPTSARIWTTQTDQSIKDFRVQSPQGGIAASELKSTHRLVDFDLAAYGALAKETGIDPLVAWGTLGRDPGPEALRMFFERMGPVGSMESESVLAGLAIGDGAGFDFRAGEIKLSGDMRGMTEGRADMRIALAAAGLAFGNMLGPTASPFLPRALRLDLGVARFPVGALAALAARTDGAGFAPGGATDPLSMIGDLLGQGEISVRINPSHIESELMRVDLFGGFQADPARQIAQGAVTFEVNGLQAALRRLREQRNDPIAAQAAAMLTMLQTLGKPLGPGGRADGPLGYELALTPAGEFLVNGMDMSALSGMGGPPQRR